MKLNINTILLLLGGLATIGPDLTGLAAWLSNIHVGWMTHVVHGLGFAATACGALALALPKLLLFWMARVLKPICRLFKIAASVVGPVTTWKRFISRRNLS